MKIDAHRHSRNLGSRCEATHTTPLDSGLRRNDGGEAAVIFIPLLGLGKAMGSSRNLGNRCEVIHTPGPWIPAYAGMTVGRPHYFHGNDELGPA